MATAAVTLAALPAVALAASKPPSKPSAAQIRAAVRRAERSRDLWATVNICNKASTRPTGNKLVGIRAQLPALGFASRLFLKVTIEYWSAPQQKFIPTQTYGPKSFGVSTHRALQSGVVFSFKTPSSGTTFTLRAIATMEWRIGRRVLGRVVRATGGGYKHVDFSDPPGFSAAQCTITS